VGANGDVGVAGVVAFGIGVAGVGMSGAGPAIGAVAPLVQVMFAAPWPTSIRGLASAPACGGRTIVMPIVVLPPPTSLGVTSTLARPDASVGTSTTPAPS
jgi:hypothetical protein